MTQSNSSGSELSQRLEALGLKLKMHLEQTGGGEMPEALNTLKTSVTEAFDAAGNAVRDEAVRDDLREIGRLIAEAASTTFNRVASDVRDLIDHRRS